MMSRICRVISTILILTGLVFLGFYIFVQSAGDKTAVFDQPSYYVIQNYWYIYLAGIVVLLFSLLGSFFSWFKGMEEKEEILPNAGYSSKKDIAGWMDGTSLDTVQISEEDKKKPAMQYENKMDESSKEEKTEILEGDQTQILDEGNKTEVLEIK